MKHILLVAFMAVGLFANTHPYKKEIVLEKITEPTLVKLKLDNEIYTHTANDFRDVRLKSKSGEEGYFIKPQALQPIMNEQTVGASNYSREEGKLSYKFKEPFDVESIDLNIEDRNFESLVDVYAEGKLIVEKEKIFDYSDETGTRNFKIIVPKIRAKSLTLIYHLDETTSFYKKYQHLREMRKYLTIKSVTFSNNNRAKEQWDTTSITLLNSKTENRVSSYIFHAKNIPFSKLEPEIIEQNFKREGKLYGSTDAKEWHFLNSFSISSSTISKEYHTQIEASGRANYLKLSIENGDNKALNIKSLKLYTKAKYLYFIANPNEEYTLYLGDKTLTQPFYELATLLSSDVASLNGEFKPIEALKVDKVVHKTSFFEEHKELLFALFILLAVGVMSYVAFGLLKRREEQPYEM